MEENVTKHQQDSTAAPFYVVAVDIIQRKLLSKSVVIVSFNGVVVFVVTRANELFKNTHVNKLTLADGDNSDFFRKNAKIASIQHI
jgi:hypothetical protein